MGWVESGHSEYCLSPLWRKGRAQSKGGPHTRTQRCRGEPLTPFAGSSCQYGQYVTAAEQQQEEICQSREAIRLASPRLCAVRIPRRALTSVPPDHVRYRVEVCPRSRVISASLWTRSSSGYTTMTSKQPPSGLPGLSLSHLFTLQCAVGTPVELGDGGLGASRGCTFFPLRPLMLDTHDRLLQARHPHHRRHVQWQDQRQSPQPRLRCAAALRRHDGAVSTARSVSVG